MNPRLVPIRVCILLSACLMLSGAGFDVLLAQTAGVASLRPIAQVDRVPAGANFGPKMKLAGHVPGWANASSEVSGRAADLALDSSTPWRVSITLQRDATVQAAFEQLLADQQDPKSPMYHQWLTAAQIGEVYGPTQHDVDALAGWLSSQGLKLVDVSPSRMLIDADGTLGSVSDAFGTSFGTYALRDRDGGEVERRAAKTEPVVPAVLAPVIGAIGGMAESYVEPYIHVVRKVDESKPNYTGSSTDYEVTPGDFYTIYDINSVVKNGNTGAAIGSVTNSNCPVTTAQCIAIIGRSRVTTADVATYMSSYEPNGVTSYNLTQTAVPSGSGGSDPGDPYNGDTQEATLDAERVVGTAYGAQAVMVVSASVSGTDGVQIATAYNVNTLEYPVMTLSFGACEANESTAARTTYTTLFSQAAGEGITTLVSSGDAAAAGCDTHGSTPPVSQELSTNFLCATGYVTCVGGTEFNDASSYSTYWSNSNGTGGVSALSYIPEGAWNEPGTAGSYVVDGTGGGVSTYVTKPSFQTGTGVPADGYRDEPDVAFTASGHDPYRCKYTSSSSSGVGTYDFSGTSASAPGMAGIAALLNTRLGAQQGSINTLIYSLAASSTGAFHDVTVSTSGVTSCSTATPSMCNNSTAGSASSLTGGQAGYAVTTGFDQATGWGSLDVANFLNAASVLSVASSHSGGFISPSTGDTYTLTVTSGAGTISGLMSVVDTLPSGFTATAMSGTGWSCTLATTTCTQTASSLAGNTTLSTITLTVSISSGYSGTYNNAVSVSLAGTVEDSVTDATAVAPLLAPTLTLSFSPTAVAVSGSATQIYTFTNPGTAASDTGVAFSATNPTHLTNTGGSYNCTAPTIYSNAVTLSGATLTAGESCFVHVSSNSSVAGLYTLTTSTITSTNAGSGSAASATLIVGAELNATSAHSGTFAPNSTGDQYTLTVTNNAASAVATTSGTAVTVTDTLPSGFTATAMSGTGWSCTVSPVSCSRSDSLAAGSSYPAITLTVSVSGSDSGSYTNNVSASGGGGFSGGAGTDATTVAAGTATTFTVTGLGPFTSPGIAGTATVTAKDAYGNVATGFTGTVTITSSDSSATLPAAYTYMASDAGVHGFSVTLHTAGTLSVTATSGSVTGSETGIIVEDAVWLINAAGTFAKLNSAGGSLMSGGSSGTASTLGGVAFDSSGSAWSVGNAVNTLYFASSAGTGATSYTGGGLNAPVSVAVDGAGYVWVANSGNASVSVFKNTGVAVSGTGGYVGNACTAMPCTATAIGAGPSGVAIDASGGVWVVSKTAGTVTHLVGAATPAVTPLASGVANATLGTKP